MMELPTAFLSQISQGRVILVLGSGASRSARHPNGKKPPLSSELGDTIAK